MREWALLFFTLLLQAAIGGIVMICWFNNTLLTDLNAISKMNIVAPTLFVLILFSVIGLISSFFHLGNPLHALNILRNYRTSWMSREVIFTGAFVALLVVNVLWVMLTREISNPLMLITAVIGLIDVYAMAAIYMNTFFTQWKPLYTCFSFYGTTFLLGTMVTQSGISITLYLNEMTSQMSLVMIQSAAFSVVALLMLLFSAFGIQSKTQGMELSESIEKHHISKKNRELFGRRVFMLLLGYMLLFAAILIGPGLISVLLVGLTFVMICGAEFMGRYHFYTIGG